MSQLPSSRPVYVLGAGFSKAINQAMPVTNELGAALTKRLSGEIEINQRSDENFEAWLTLQVTPLPFLHDFENSRRAADAARVIDEIARILDEQVDIASEEPTPLWLRQLIAVWHAERAIVLTFNYDTLIERAVNVSVPAVISPMGHVRYVLGDHIVFPAPPAPQAQYIGDSGVGHTEDSFELLKMHGSLTWYWASADPTGSTLMRVREKHVLGTSNPLASEADFSGTTTLDRYLIPPITSKEGYYSSYLANTLWRTARSHIASAKCLTLIGYSLPPEDRAASQLIAQVPKDVPVAVVDRDPGEQAVPHSILGNLRRLDISATTVTSGEQSVTTFVSRKLRAAIETLPNLPAFHQLENSHIYVVVAISRGWGTHDSDDLFALSWSEEMQVFQANRIPDRLLRDAYTSYQDSVLDSVSLEHQELQHFMTASQLHLHIRDGAPFTFQEPNLGRTLVAIGAIQLELGGRELLELKWAPYA